ncbi:recombinase family protein [Mesorhizobium sp. 10J20-29]
MTTVGYARVSSTGQSLDAQRARLLAAGVGTDEMFEEKRSGADAKRPKLQECLKFVRRGDVLLVTKIDRIARSASDFHAILKTLADKEVGFRALDDAEADTTTRSGKLLLGILALIAEFENDIRRERQADGIAMARKKGVKFGRRPTLTHDVVNEIIELRSSGETVPSIMKAKKLSKASVYRALAKAQQAGPT